MQIFIQKAQNSSELCLIEMQGDLESRLGADVSLAGKFIGDAHFTKDNGVPILIIGHHILYGKVVKLEKPFAVLRKVKTDSDSGSSKTEFEVDAIIKKKLLFKARPKPIIANVPKKI